MSIRRLFAIAAPVALVMSAFAAAPAGADAGASGPPPTIALTPRSGQAGRRVTITGGGYAAGDLLRVRYVTGLASPKTVTLCRIKASAGGTFECKPQIPTADAGPLGRHHVTVVDVSDASAAHAVTIFRLR